MIVASKTKIATNLLNNVRRSQRVSKARIAKKKVSNLCPFIVPKIKDEKDSLITLTHDSSKRNMQI